MEEVLIPIVLFMVIGATIIAAVIFRFLEKKKLLEKDLPAEDLYNLMGVDREVRKSYWLAVSGTIMIFFSVGLGAGFWLDKLTNEDPLVAVAISLFTGIGLITAHYYRSHLVNKELHSK
jgi:hypothetical protein